MSKAILNAALTVTETYTCSVCHRRAVSAPFQINVTMGDDFYNFTRFIEYSRPDHKPHGWRLVRGSFGSDCVYTCGCTDAPAIRFETMRTHIGVIRANVGEKPTDSQRRAYLEIKQICARLNLTPPSYETLQRLDFTELNARFADLSLFNGAQT